MRWLWKSPGFAAAALVTLSLGIGATSAPARRPCVYTLTTIDGLLRRSPCSATDSATRSSAPDSAIVGRRIMLNDVPVEL
jgi:hypothetical protein